MTKTIAFATGFCRRDRALQRRRRGGRLAALPARSPGAYCRGRAWARLTAPFLGPALLRALERALPPSLAMPGSRRLRPVVFQLLITSGRGRRARIPRWTPPRCSFFRAGVFPQSGGLAIFGGMSGEQWHRTSFGARCPGPRSFDRGPMRRQPAGRPPAGVNDAWCMIDWEGNSHCYYASSQECLAAVASGTHGFCNVNPQATPSAASNAQASRGRHR